MAGASRGRPWWMQWLHVKSKMGKNAVYDSMDGIVKVVGVDKRGFVKVEPIKKDESFGGYSVKTQREMGIIK